MNIPFSLGEGLQQVALLAQVSTSELGYGGLLTMLAVFAALVTLIGLMMGRRKTRPSEPKSSPADPFDEARHDEPVEAGVDSDFRR